MANGTSRKRNLNSASKAKAENKKKEEGDLKDWTVMVFMAGDNDLSAESVWGIKEMFRVGISHNIGVVVQFDPRGPKNSRRYVLKASKEPMNDDGIIDTPKVKMPMKDADSAIHLEKLSSFKDASINNIKELSKVAQKILGFIHFAMKRCEAKRYLLILSGHGSGAVGDVLLRDENPAAFLTIHDLSKLLHIVARVHKKRAGGKLIDILGFDSCNMAAIEVGFNLKTHVNYLISSEGFEDNTGWPYHRLLETINRESEITPVKLSRKIVEKHSRFYRDFTLAEVSSDLSATDLSQSTPLTDAITELGGILKAKLDNENAQVVGSIRSIPAVTNAVIVAHWRAQSYNFEEYVDLWDFCDILESSCADTDVITACQEVKKILNNRKNYNGEKYDDTGKAKPYVLKSCYTRDAFQYSNGVAIYFPWVETSDLRHYRKIAFSRRTKWNEFISAYVEHTRRPARPGNGDLHEKVTKNNKVFLARHSNIRRDPPFDRRDPPFDRGTIIIPKIKNIPIDYRDDNCDEES